MTALGRDEYEDWQTALLVIGFIAFGIFGMWLYWRTGDGYKIRQAQKKLGYDVPPIWTHFKILCMCCVGPYERRKWESEHKFWRNHSYGDPNQKWQGERLHDLSAPWRRIPPGERRTKKLVHKALHAAKAHVMLKVLDEAIAGALAAYIKDAIESREAEKRVERLKALAAKRQQQRLQREEEERRELAALMVSEYQADSSSEDEWDLGAGEWGAPVLGIGAGADAAAPRRKSQVQVRWGEAEDIVSNPAKPTGGAPKKSALKQPAQTSNWGGDGEWGAPVVPAPKGGKEPPGVTRIDVSSPMTLSQLRQKTRDMTPSSAMVEFDRIPLNMPGAAMLPSGADKLNRSPAYFPFPHTRARVEPVSGSEGHSYINASYVRGPDGFPEKYLVTQAPMSGGKGKRATVGDFWRLVWSHKSSVVLMLEPARPYWPTEQGQPMKFGALTVTLSKVDVKNGYTETHLVVSNSELKQMLRVTHYFFEAWPVDGERRSINSTLAFLHELHTKTDGLKVPLVVHDREGTGRCGTIIAVEHAIFQVETKQECDVMGIVASLREDRAGLVRTPEEYVLVHKAATMYSLAVGAAPPPKHPGAPPAFTPSGDSGSRLPRKQSVRLEMA